MEKFKRFSKHLMYTWKVWIYLTQIAYITLNPSSTKPIDYINIVVGYGVKHYRRKISLFFQRWSRPKLFLRLILKLPQTGQERWRDGAKGLWENYVKRWFSKCSDNCSELQSNLHWSQAMIWGQTRERREMSFRKERC